VNRLDSLLAPEGLYSFITESNSLYQVKISKGKRTLLRFPQTSDSKAELRKDNEELTIIGEFSIVVGEPAIFIVEPLGIFADFTIRRTNIVKSISYIN
jgi:hypothetical protein